MANRKNLHRMLTLAYAVLCRASSSSVTRQLFANENQLPCVSNGRLTPGSFVENGKCVDESAFFYDIRQGSWSPIGLKGGARTDIELLFGSIGKPTSEAMDFENPGLKVPNGGSIELEFSSHFLNNNGKTPPVPNLIVEMGSGSQNRIYGEDCPFQNLADPTEAVKREVSCGGWTSSFGSTDSQRVVIQAPTEGIKGSRYAQAGIKYIGIHPNVDSSAQFLFRNANGYCKSTANLETKQLCTFKIGCESGDFCVETPLQAYVVVTVLDADNRIVMMGKRTVNFTTKELYGVAATNYGLQNDMEPNESVDFTHIEAGQRNTAGALLRPGNVFSSVKEEDRYAPRFVLFNPTNSKDHYPYSSPRQLSATLNSDGDEGIILSAGIPIGKVTLIKPVQWSSAILRQPSGSTINGVDPKIGGSLFAIGVDFVDNGYAGTYIVRVTMNGGPVAESRIVVDGSSTVGPTSAPTNTVTSEPTDTPTKEPTQEPTGTPTLKPSDEPTKKPTSEPSKNPTLKPTVLPTVGPTTETPTKLPTVGPTEEPTKVKTTRPTESPTVLSTIGPTDTLTPPTAASIDITKGSFSAFGQVSSDVFGFSSLIPTSWPDSIPRDIPPKPPLTASPTATPAFVTFTLEGISVLLQTFDQPIPEPKNLESTEILPFSDVVSIKLNDTLTSLLTVPSRDTPTSAPTLVANGLLGLSSFRLVGVSTLDSTANARLVAKPDSGSMSMKKAPKKTSMSKMKPKSKTMKAKSKPKSKPKSKTMRAKPSKSPSKMSSSQAFSEPIKHKKKKNRAVKNQDRTMQTRRIEKRKQKQKQGRKRGSKL